MWALMNTIEYINISIVLSILVYIFIEEKEAHPRFTAIMFVWNHEGANMPECDVVTMKIVFFGIFLSAHIQRTKNIAALVKIKVERRQKDGKLSEIEIFVNDKKWVVKKFNLLTKCLSV
jgi:hypothetical protein